MNFKGKNNPFWGKKHTPEQKEKWSIARKNSRHTPEARKKISEALKRQWKSGERKHYGGSWNRGMRGEYKLWPNGRTFSKEHRANLGKAHIGLKNAYKHGKSKLYQLIRGSKEFKDWRYKVKTRSEWICEGCGARNGEGKRVILHADHYPKGFAEILQENKITSLKQAIACEELWDIENGRTLCKDCHKKTPNYCRQLQRLSAGTPTRG